MELTDLKGNALKVYLKLLEGRDAQGVCRLSQRELSRQLDLYRDTVGHTLGQLERFGLIEGRDPGWSVSPQLLADYLHRSGWKNQPVEASDDGKNQPPTSPSGWKNQPRASEGSGKKQPPASDSGWKNQPPLPEGGGKKQPPVPDSGWKNQPLPSSDPGHGWKNQPLPAPADPPTRTRTLWSSSSEEDSTCTAVPPSSSSLLPSSSPPGEGRGEEGGLGGENPAEQKEGEKTSPGEEGKNTPGEAKETPGEAKPRKIPPPSLYLSQMQSWWDAIWPDNLDEEIPWFGELWEEFGEELPVQALRQFADRGRTLADLDYPERFQRYFRTCCRNAQQGTPPPPEKASAPSAARPSSKGNGRRQAAVEPAPELAVRALLEERSVPVPRRPSPAGNGRHPAAAEPAPESASDTGGTPVRTDCSAEEVPLKEELVNHMATFWANQPEAPHTRSADHFLAAFRRERRRP